LYQNNSQNNTLKFGTAYGNALYIHPPVYLNTWCQVLEVCVL